MKVVLDTNVFVDFFRHPNHQKDFESRLHRPLLFMSSVVAQELYARCRTSRQQKELASFLKPFEKAARLVTPDAIASDVRTTAIRFTIFIW